MVFERFGDIAVPEDANLLGESITLPFSGRIAKSRFLKGAMTERMSTWDQHDISKRGVPSDRLVNLYSAWSTACYGIVLTGNVMVHPEHIESPGAAILYAPHETPERIEQFRKLATAGKSDGSLIVMQLSHAGRQVAAYVNPHPVSAGDIKLGDMALGSFGQPTPLSKQGIKEIVGQFAYAAETAYRTGFDGVQLHGAHGYLISQFLSLTTNNRTDEYGGSIQNRARFIREIVEEIRIRVTDPNFVIGIKINSTEFQASGIKTDEAVELCQILESLGFDFVELSGGNYEALAFKHDESKPRESTRRREAFFTEFAEQITPRLTKTVVYVTGGFHTAAGMAEAVRSGSCAGIGLGRPAASDVNLPADIIAGKVAGATGSRLPPNNYLMANVAAGTQMEAIARGQPVFDLSDPNVAERFRVALEAFQARMAKDISKGVVNAGYLVLG